MNVAELKVELAKFNDNDEVMILDGFNGVGSPRTINMGPYEHTITVDDAEDSGDCEGYVGRNVVIMGYGCY